MMSSNAGFWETIDLIVDREIKTGNKEEVVQEWLNKLIIRRKKSISGDFARGESVKSNAKDVSQDTKIPQNLTVVDADGQ